MLLTYIVAYDFTLVDLFLELIVHHFYYVAVMCAVIHPEIFDLSVFPVDCHKVSACRRLKFLRFNRIPIFNRKVRLKLRKA